MRLCAAVLVVFALLVPALPQVPPPAPAAATCLVVPFENRSGDPSLDWIGESFVIALRQALASASIAVLNQAQRNTARTLAGAPETAVLSHATLLRMADDADTHWMIAGWYGYDGDRLSVTASVFDVEKEHMVGLAPLTSSLDQIETLQGKLGWAALLQIAPASTPDPDAGAPRLPLAAYENYVRAQMATVPATRLHYLMTAAHLAPQDARVLLALGLAEWQMAKLEPALATLIRVPASASQAPQAQFTAALAAYKLGQYDRSVELLRPLVERLPLPAVTNNLALAQAAARHQPSDLTLETAFPDQGFEQLAQVVLQHAGRLFAQGQLDPAWQIYADTAANPASTPQQRAAAHAGLAQICYARHDGAQATREVALALAADPHNASALALQKTLALHRR